MYVYNILVTGFNPSENIKVSWDYDSQYMENNVPNHQPKYVFVLCFPNWLAPNLSVLAIDIQFWPEILVISTNKTPFIVYV